MEIYFTNQSDTRNLYQYYISLLHMYVIEYAIVPVVQKLESNLKIFLFSYIRI